MTGGGWRKKGRSDGFSSLALCLGLVEKALKLLSVCFPSLWAKGRPGETFKNFCTSTYTKYAAFTCTPPLRQHLNSLLPKPANYSFTFSWMLYQGMPSHYSRQLATAKGRPLRTHPAKGQLTRCWTLPQALWHFVPDLSNVCFLPSSHFLTTGFHKTSRSGSQD